MLHVSFGILSCTVPDLGEVLSERVIVYGFREGVIGGGVPFGVLLPFAVSVWVLDGFPCGHRGLVEVVANGDVCDGVQVVDGRVLDEVGRSSAPDLRIGVLWSLIWLTSFFGGELRRLWLICWVTMYLRRLWYWLDLVQVVSEVLVPMLELAPQCERFTGGDHEWSEWMWRVAHLGELFHYQLNCVPT